MAENLEGTQGAENQEETTKTYSQEEVDALLQQETDRRVTAALKKAEEKNKEKLKEAEKLAKMNEQERYEHELEQREKAIAEKERALNLAENKNTASKILAEKGLSLQLVDFVVAEDAETMNANIKLLDNAFKASVKAEVEKRLGGKTPGKGAGTEPETLTKDSFKKLTLAQKDELYRTDPELYNSLRD